MMGEKLLDYLAAHPATALAISKKLAERFVADKTSADTGGQDGGHIPSIRR
jgi:uncharacterized protein (DUF1800 family)